MSVLLDTDKKVVLSFRLSIADTLRLENGYSTKVVIKGIAFTIHRIENEAEKCL